MDAADAFVAIAANAIGSLETMRQVPTPAPGGNADFADVARRSWPGHVAVKVAAPRRRSTPSSRLVAVARTEQWPGFSKQDPQPPSASYCQRRSVNSRNRNHSVSLSSEKTPSGSQISMKLRSVTHISNCSACAGRTARSPGKPGLKITSAMQRKSPSCGEHRACRHRSGRCVSHS